MSTVEELELGVFEPLDQQFLDFGEVGIKPMVSLRLQEPLYSLGLASHTERRLQESGLVQVKDLIPLCLEQGNAKGISLGHIEEIRKRLLQVFPSLSDVRVSCFENLSLLRCLLGRCERKSTALFLRQYQLEAVSPVPPALDAEIKRMTAESKAEALAEVSRVLASEEKQQWLAKTLSDVARHLIDPWLETRQGFAWDYEIEEWVEYHCEHPLLQKGVIDVLQQELGVSAFIWKDCFTQVGSSRLYAKSKAKAEVIEQAWKLIDELFYKPGQVVDYHFVYERVKAKFASHWQELTPQFLDRILWATERYSFICAGERRKLKLQLLR